ncbi:MAG: transposase [Trichodesmium sp. MO_231.B1]|nr:transposase [Trichodesmium sp. MO_231.B1]
MWEKQDLSQLKQGGGRERTNSWMERCKSLAKNLMRTLENATAKVNLCFVRLLLKRLALAEQVRQLYRLIVEKKDPLRGSIRNIFFSLG